MKKILFSMVLFVFITLLVGCAKNGYSIKDYENAHIVKDGVYLFNNPKIEKYNLLVKINTVIDEKTGKEKREFFMTTIDKNSKNYTFNINSKDVIKWPFYNIDKRNIVSTRIYEKGTFEELKHRHPYFISGSSYKDQMGFSYKLDFSKAKFIQ